MSVEDEKVMKQYDITIETKSIYRYKQHRYENLRDAVNFAKFDSDMTKDAKMSKKD